VARAAVANPVDGSSIGIGTWDPATQSNVPYRIDGMPTIDQLSVYFPSSYSFGGYACGDIRSDCN
jgi:hypothetical protein